MDTIDELVGGVANFLGDVAKVIKDQLQEGQEKGQLLKYKEHLPHLVLALDEHINSI